MTAITEETAAVTEEISSTVQEQTRAMNNVTSQTNQLQAIGVELDNLIKKFTY